MEKKEQILELLKAYENETEFDGQAINERKYNALATDIVKLFAIPVVCCSLPSKEIIDYLERSIDGFGIANKFYNAALNDTKYFINKRLEELNKASN